MIPRCLQFKIIFVCFFAGISSQIRIVKFFNKINHIQNGRCQWSLPAGLNDCCTLGLSPFTPFWAWNSASYSLICSFMLKRWFLLIINFVFLLSCQLSIYPNKYFRLLLCVASMSLAVFRSFSLLFSSSPHNAKHT